MKSKRSRQNRTYKVKKTGIKDENIDRQIWVIHHAICQKLISDYQSGGVLTSKVTEQISQRYEEGRMGYGEYITWISALELIDDPQSFQIGVLEDTPRMRKLRRRTPFVGILTEQERQKALRQDALGTVSIETLF